jgi:ABC-type methionine transport system ATPase subunit
LETTEGHHRTKFGFTCLNVTRKTEYINVICKWLMMDAKNLIWQLNVVIVFWKPKDKVPI